MFIRCHIIEDMRQVVVVVIEGRLEPKPDDDDDVVDDDVVDVTSFSALNVVEINKYKKIKK